MFLEIGEYALITIAFISNIWQNYARLALSETTLLCLCFSCCSLLAFTSNEFSNLYFYRHKDTGIMFSFLLPCIHMSLSFKASSDNNQTLNFFHIGCILFSFLPAIFELLRYKIASDNFSNISYLASLSFILIFAYWFVLLLHKLDLMSFIFICFLLCIQIYLLLNIPTWLPGSFTFGELVVLSQSFIYFLFQFFSTFLSIRTQRGVRSGNQYVTDYNLTIFIYVLVASVSLFVVLISHFKWLRDSWIKFYMLLVVTFCTFSLPILHFWMKDNVVEWFFAFTLQSKHSLLLLSFWIFNCVLAVSVVMYNNRSLDEENKDEEEEFRNSYRFIQNFFDNEDSSNNNENQSNSRKNNNEKSLNLTCLRKIFHVMIVVVFIPSYFLNQQLFCLATVAALALFVLLESIRVLDIPPLGQPLRKHLKVFLDQQDSGSIIVTPIYLLIGCSAPLWISIGRNLSPLMAFVGVISIGFGDTMASLVGSKVGRLRWKGSRKTVEGTLASFVAQFISSLLILLIFSDQSFNILKIFCVTIMTSLTEAFTSQIDNLVLPAFMYFALL